MLDGYWTFGGEDVVNHARTQAYLDHGLSPAGVSVSTEDGTVEQMLPVLNGGEQYASPIADGAPWVESGDSDTWDFAGVIVTDITGVNGSTRTAEVTQYVGNGGGVSKPRYGTRSIAVTAMLVGRTGASVEAGLAWLSTALAGDCDGGVELCGFTAAPEQYLDTPIVGADPITEIVDRRVDGWAASAGRFRSRDGWFDPDAVTPGAPGRYGSALYGVSTYAVGGPVFGVATYGEAVYGQDIDRDPYLLAPEQQCYVGEVVWSWNLSTARGAARVSYGARLPDGTILRRSDTVTLQGDATLRFIPDPTWEAWVPVLWVEGNPVRVQPTITHTPYRTAAECADGYLRSYLDVSTVEGPTVIDKVQFGCGEWALKVEWTWVVGNPFVFGSITPLVTDFSTASGTAFATEPGVLPVTVAQLFTSTEACVPPTVSLLQVAVTDPCCPGFIPPPSAPSIRDACWTPPDSWRRFAFTVPPRLAPSNHDGLLSLQVTSDSRPKRGVRVRLYTDPLGRGLDGIDECSFCTEFNLTYLPPDATLVIDAARQRITTKIAGVDEIDTAANVRGANGGPFDFPTLQCNTGYLVVLDVPDDYGQACSPYAVGDPQGDLTFAMSLRPATI